MHPTAPARTGSLLCGLAGLALIPALALADTALAVRGGWAVGSAGVFGLLPRLLALALGAAAVLLLMSSSFRDWVRRRGRQLLALAVSTLIGCGLAEGFLRGTRTPPAFHLRPPGTVYEYQANSFQMPGVFDEAHSTINSRGIRGAELPADRAAYRLLCVGGSTTECYYLDDVEAWPAVLGEQLNAAGKRPVWVGSAGYSEYGVAQHARFVAQSPLFDEVDCVVVLAGVNDLLQTLLGLSANEDLPGPWWYRTQLVDLAKETWNLRLGQGLVVDREGNRLGMARWGREIRPRPLDIDQWLANYELRLRSLTAAAKQRRVRLVLVTQPVLWDDFLSTLGLRRLRWARVYPIPRSWDLLEAGPLRKAMDQYNQRLRETAASTGVELVDAAAKMTAVEMHFYDDFHLTETGCRTLGELLAEAISVPEAPPAGGP